MSAISTDTTSPNHTLWRNVGLVATGVGLAATLLNRQYPQVQWPHPLAVKYFGPGLAAGGAILATIKQAQTWLMPTEEESEVDLEELFTFDVNTCQVFTKKGIPLAQILSEGNDSQLNPNRAAKRNPYREIPRRWISGDYFLKALTLDLEDYLTDLCTQDNAFPIVRWLDPVQQMANLRANYVATNGETLFNDLDEEARLVFSIMSEAEWKSHCDTYSLDETTTLKALADGVSSSLTVHKKKQVEKSTADLIAEASAFGQEDFLRRNARDGSVAWLKGEINPIVAREKLRLLFALQVGASSFDSLDTSQKRAAKALSIEDDDYWQSILSKVDEARRTIEEGLIDFLASADSLVINRMALKLARIDVRTILERRWDSVTFTEALEHDGDLVWEMMDIGNAPATHGYIASKWHERVVEETRDWSLVDILKNEPRLLSYGVLEQKDVADRFEAEKEAVHDEVRSTLADTSNPRTKLLKRCKWLLPE